MSSRDGERSPDAEMRRPSAYFPVTQVRPSRRAVWGGAISAVAIGALLASVFALIPHMRGTGHPITATATATSLPPSCPADQITLKVPTFSEFTKLVMTSPTNGWIIGSTTNTTTWDNNPDPLLVHFHDCRWETIPSPVPGTTVDLSDISMDSADDGWAVGTQGSDFNSMRCLLLHYTGGQWRPAPVPSALPTNRFTKCYAVSMLSPEEGWMLAYWETSGNSKGGPHLLHYVDGTWTVVDAFVYGAYALAADGPDDVWVAGMRMPAANDPNPITRVDMLHYQHGQFNFPPRCRRGSAVSHEFAIGWLVDRRSGASARVSL